MPTQVPATASPSSDPFRAETLERRGPPDARSARTGAPSHPSTDVADDAPFAGEIRDGDDTRDRHETIAETAYLEAEKRGFAFGEEELDWLEAEQELIEALSPIGAGDRLGAIAGAPHAGADAIGAELFELFADLVDDGLFEALALHENW